MVLSGVPKKYLGDGEVFLTEFFLQAKARSWLQVCYQTDHIFRSMKQMLKEPWKTHPPICFLNYCQLWSVAPGDMECNKHQTKGLAKTYCWTRIYNSMSTDVLWTYLILKKKHSLSILNIVSISLFPLFLYSHSYNTVFPGTRGIYKGFSNYLSS